MKVTINNPITNQKVEKNENWFITNLIILKILKNGKNQNLSATPV